MAETKSDAVTDIDDLLTAYNEVQKELTEARRCWREEFDRRKALQKQFDSLGQGTGFLDVEKLSEDLYTAEKYEYTRQES